MFALPLGILCAAGCGLLFIGIAIFWRAAKFVILIAGTTYMVTTLVMQSANANVPVMAQVPDPVPEWADPYVVFDEDYIHRSYPYLYLFTFYELIVITEEKFIDYPHVFLTLDACLEAGIASKHFEEDYMGFLCEKEKEDSNAVKTLP